MFHSSTRQTDGDRETVGVGERGESFCGRERSEWHGIQTERQARKPAGVRLVAHTHK